LQQAIVTHLFIEHQRHLTFAPGRSGVVGRVLLEGKSVQIADVHSDQEYVLREIARLGDFRTILGVPLLREGNPIGVLVLHRAAVRPFTDEQVALVQNFAAQAVIAIENARLLNELRQRTTDLTERTADLTEALEQQIATSEVLQVISSSPGDLEPVFASMLENAVRICDATFGNIDRWDGEVLHMLAAHNTPPAFAEARRHLPFRRLPSRPTSHTRRMVETKTVAHVADLAASEDYIERNPRAVAAVELGGVRTFLVVPMLKENEMIGSFSLYRQEVRPFTDKQIELVTNFAVQAVIAIENERLLNELRQSLDQQTATANVLEVISRSVFDLRAVFETVAESSVRLCGADRAFIFQFDGALLRMEASYNATPEFAEWVKQNPIRPGRHSGSARAALERKTVHIPDVRADPEYVYGAKDVEAIRTVLGVPILKGNELLGVMMIYHLEVRPFTDNQIALVETFADQAAIAIENVRLFEAEQQRTRENVRLLTELRERTAEVEKLNQQLEQRVTDQVGEIERMGRLRRFLPPQVADLIVASGTEKQLESHRREITALFCDLRGFTGFSESADPEDVMALLREYHAAIGDSIIKYSGTLERYAGDGVMVVFNDPVPVENPALQAVLMALEMRDAIAALTETWRRWGHDIGFGIGIAHGFATLGTIGFEGRFDYAAIGTVSNVASRLCDEAKPGQILISPRVLTKVENAVTVEPVGEFALKGIRRPLAAYNVLAAISA
jgi:GAF domain-containing protein